jgi:hypothetical protein
MDTKIERELRILKAYAITSSLLILALFVMGAVNDRKKEKLDEIEVQRINVIEPNGTLRMVISNQSVFPGAIIKGREYPHEDRKTAGILFFNEEGTENGGLIFGGSHDKDGRLQSYGHLSFDRYDQDQVLNLEASEDGIRRKSSLTILDQPDWPITDILSLPRSERPKFLASHSAGHARVYLGRNDDKSASLKLKDAEGRDRIIIQVAADGSPVLQFLDESGKVVSQLPALGLK